MAEAAGYIDVLEAELVGPDQQFNRLAAKCVARQMLDDDRVLSILQTCSPVARKLLLNELSRLQRTKLIGACFSWIMNRDGAAAAEPLFHTCSESFVRTHFASHLKSPHVRWHKVCQRHCRSAAWL